MRELVVLQLLGGVICAHKGMYYLKKGPMTHLVKPKKTYAGNMALIGSLRTRLYGSKRNMGGLASSWFPVNSLNIELKLKF